MQNEITQDQPVTFEQIAMGQQISELFIERS